MADLFFYCTRPEQGMNANDIPVSVSQAAITGPASYHSMSKGVALSKCCQFPVSHQYTRLHLAGFP